MTDKAPRRLQLSRKKGYRKPDGVITVARPSKFGNPFPVDGSWTVWAAVGLGYRGDVAGRRAAVVAMHRSWLLREPVILGPGASDQSGGSIVFGHGDDAVERTVSEHAMGIARFCMSMYDPPVLPDDRPDVTELAGRDLACWCPLDQPCHADVLLEVANG